jgi:hypothetical protein
MKWRVAGIVFVSLAVALGFVVMTDGSSRQSGSSDRAATESYLQNRDALEQERAARLGTSRKAVGSLVASLSRKCPAIMKGAPHDEQFETLALERFVILSLALLRSQASSSTTYAEAAGHLRWSNAKLTRLVHAWLDEEAANDNLVTPNACVDMRAWVKSGYHRLSASTTGFLARSDAIDSRTRTEKRRLGVPPVTRTGKVVLNLLEPYESSKYREIDLQLKQLEAELFSSNLTIVASGASKLSRALGATK